MKQHHGADQDDRENPDRSSEYSRQILSLTRQKEMYRSVFENTGTGTIIIDPDMLILFVNARFEALVGYSRQEIEKRMKWSEFVFPDDNEMMQRYHYGRRKGLPGIPDEYECRVLTKSGDIKYIYMKVGMIPETGRSIASFMDITQRKLAEERLKESESRMSEIIRTFEGLIYITTADFRIDFMNSALIRRAGEQASGRKCYSAIHGLDSPCPWCHLESVLAGKTHRWEQKSPRDDRWYWSIQSPVYDGTEKITKAQTVLMDITGRKRREQKIAEDADLLRNENIALRSALKERYRFGDIIGKSRVMQTVYELIVKAASSSAHVILYGESGTGKELVAKAIHTLSMRRSGRFVPVNCGAVSEHILESEFFGHRKGAFTGAGKDKEGFLAAADGGTLFLDEIGDIALNLQVKLLRAIEGGGYTPVGSSRVIKPDLRIIAATNKDLKQLVKKGLMREDFFYRVHIIPIQLPPLRNRKEDLSLLIDHFLSSYGAEAETPVPSLDANTMEAFNRYDWPGNVRELQNTLYRYVTLGKIDFIDNPGMGGEVDAASDTLSSVSPLPGDLSKAMEAFEKALIMRTLEENRWQKAKTADALGIHRKTLFTKMNKLGLK